MRTVEITCDGCGADIATTGNTVDYRLSLSSENRDPRGGFATCMGKYPSLRRGCHFCDLKCLDHWTDRRRFKDKLWRDAHQKWLVAQGIDPTAKSYSYTPMTEEYRADRDAEFTAASVIAFPFSNRPTPPPQQDSP